MKPILKLALLLPVVIFTLVSCSIMKNNIQKNNKFADKTISSFLEKNGNAFYITSTYSTASVVWTYNKNGIEINKLVKGKVVRWQGNVSNLETDRR